MKLKVPMVLFGMAFFGGAAAQAQEARMLKFPLLIPTFATIQPPLALRTSA